jgi:phage gp46-like protein
MMTAASSALQLADLALTWFEETGDADLTMIDSDVASDAGMHTAVILSLFLDAPASADDVPPSGDPSDRRGWWGDQFAAVQGDVIGSRLWLLDRAKLTTDTARLADEYAREALAWMIVDKVASSIDVTITTTSNTMFIAIGVNRPGRDAVSFRFSRVWDNP